PVRDPERVSVRHECPALLQYSDPAPLSGGGTRVHEHADQAGWPTQTGEIRESIGASGRRQAESAVEEAVPNLGRDEMVGVSHDLEVVDFPEGDVDWQLVPQWRSRVGGIGFRIEGMDVPNEGTLRMREIGDHRVRQSETGRRGVGVS